MLSLLDVGADAKMRVALHKTLGFDGPDNKTASDDLMEVRNAVRDLLRATDGPLLLANALVIDPEVKPRADAIAQMRALGAEITLADVRRPEVIKQINDWVAARTKGRIPSILDSPPAQGAVALNALYFKDFWQRQFEKSATQAKPFHGVGVSAEVPMMRQTARHAFRQDDRFVAVDLPYRTGRYSFVVLTTKDKPAPAAEFAPVASWLDGRGFRSGNVRLELPRFHRPTMPDCCRSSPAWACTRRTRLAHGVLRSLAQARSPSRASSKANVPQGQTRGQHRTAAVTGVMMATRMAEIGEVPVIVDKPFLFVLRDKESGLMIMSGYIGKPANGSFAAR